MIQIELRHSDFDPYIELQNFSSSIDMKKNGGSNIFIGSMRDFNEGDTVLAMTLEYYPGMTEKSLEKLATHASSEWPINDILLIHRVGEIKPADSIVLVACWSAHRKDAFAATRFLIDELKTKAPFWKKENLQSGTRWVEKNT